MLQKFASNEIVGVLNEKGSLTVSTSQVYEKLLQLLKSRKVKLTSVRKIILEKCVEYPGDFTAKDIVLKIQDVIPDADHTSVYRSLQLFHEHDILHFSVKQKTYSFCKSIVSHGQSDSMNSHIMFECTKCDKSIGFCAQDSLIELINEAIKKGIPNAEVSSYALSLKGVCENCRST